MSDLKPCPFCDCELTVDHDFGIFNISGSHEITCPLDAVDLPTCSSLDLLESEWNNRPHEAKIKAEVVREAINAIKSGGDEHPVIILVDLKNKLEQGE